MNEVSKPKKTHLIKGVLLKCVDGAWKDNDGCVPSGELLVVGLTHGLQCWQDQELLNEISEEDGPLPDVDELNAKIPQAEWGLGLDDKPRPPWQFNWVVYLFNPETADAYTYLNSTVGARLAVERLEAKFAMMQRLRGDVVPLVKLDNRPMKTNWGTKLRPEFTVIEWRDLGGGEEKLPQLPPPPDKDPAGIAVKPPAEKKKTPIGKPVKPVTPQEELDDEIPFI
jgi:hypothetical protein